MKWRDWLENWSMVRLRINLKFLDAEWAPQDADKNAAWELYVELLTRITTQPLAQEDGDEEAALKSVHAIFGLTRDSIKHHGCGCQEFTKLAIVVLNQVVRPFTAKWHKQALAGAFKDPARCAAFRRELAALQPRLAEYTRMLADLAGVEDLTQLEAVDAAQEAKR